MTTIAVPRRRILRPRLPKLNLAAIRRLGDPSFNRLGIRGQPWGWGRQAGEGIVPCPVVDTFTDVDATALIAHVPDVDVVGGGWVLGWQGAWDINGNQARQSAGGGGPNTILINAGIPDAILTCRFFTGVVIAGGLAVRAKNEPNSDDYIEIWLNPGPNTCTLHQVNEGVRSGALASNAVIIDPNIEYAMSVTLNGTSISVEVDGVPQFTFVTAFNQADTLFGLLQWDASLTGRWDDFQVCRL